MIGTPEILLFTLTFALVILAFYLVRALTIFLTQRRK